MSSSGYRRATKNHAVRVDHTDGSVTTGFIPVPQGMDLFGTMMQAQHFIHFETDDGEQTLMNVSSIKRVTSTESKVDKSAAEASAAEKARAEREAEEARRRAEEEARRKAARDGKVEWTGEQYDALEMLGLKASASKDEISAAYRKLVKLYHPDRLRGLGVSPKKIEFAAERLAEINNAYRVLVSSAKAA